MVGFGKGLVWVSGGGGVEVLIVGKGFFGRCFAIYVLDLCCVF